MPSLPPWEVLHPVAVHFPVAYLLLAPVLTLFAVVFAARRREWLVAALLVAALGALGANIAERTGEEAEEQVDASAAADAVLHEHEEMGEKVPVFAWALAAALGAVLVLARTGRLQLSRRAASVALLVVAALQVANAAFLAETAHLGGRLVHEFGVHAPWPGTSDSSK